MSRRRSLCWILPRLAQEPGQGQVRKPGEEKGGRAAPAGSRQGRRGDDAHRLEGDDHPRPAACRRGTTGRVPAGTATAGARRAPTSGKKAIWTPMRAARPVITALSCHSEPIGNSQASMRRARRGATPAGTGRFPHPSGRGPRRAGSDPSGSGLPHPVHRRASTASRVLRPGGTPRAPGRPTLPAAADGRPAKPPEEVVDAMEGRRAGRSSSRGCSPAVGPDGEQLPAPLLSVAHPHRYRLPPGERPGLDADEPAEETPPGTPRRTAFIPRPGPVTSPSSDTT